MKYSIIICEPHGFKHSGAFQEVAQLIYFGFKKLNYDCIITTHFNIPDRKQIVLGANLLQLTNIILKEDSIILNLERAGHDEQFSENYCNLLRKYEVWDTSWLNIERIHQRYNIKINKCLQLGYIEELNRINLKNFKDKDIDVLFCGSLSNRRKLILDEMFYLNLKIVHLFGVYGNVRDDYISRSKLLLNIHYHDFGSLHQVRMFYYLSNQCAVLTEKSDDNNENKDFENMIFLSDYKDIPKKAFDLIKNNSEIELKSLQGFKNFKKKKIEDNLRNILIN